MEQINGDSEKERLSGQVNAIEGKVELLIQQVIELQKGTPWFKDIPTIITVMVSVLALLFSFGTTYVSSKRDKSQDIQNSRSDLRIILQRLASLPKENFELYQKYADDPQAISSLSSSIAQENALLARQAAEIAKKLPASEVSATEFYSIGLALQNCYENDQAIDFLQRGLKVADDFNDEIALLRVEGNLFFITGQFDAGRGEYQKALDIFSKYKGYNDYTQKSTHIQTELSWAIAEANSGFYSPANQHVDNAENYLLSLPVGPSTVQQKKQIEQLKFQLGSGNTNSFAAPH